MRLVMQNQGHQDGDGDDVPALLLFHSLAEPKGERLEESGEGLFGNLASHGPY